MTSEMMIKITLIPPPDRADGKSAKARFDPSASGEAIRALRRTIETTRGRNGGKKEDMGSEWVLREQKGGRVIRREDLKENKSLRSDCRWWGGGTDGRESRETKVKGGKTRMRAHMEGWTNWRKRRWGPSWRQNYRRGKFDRERER